MEISNKVDIKYNKKCSLSLVLAILSMITYFGLILGILGFIYGILGLQEAKSFRQKGKSIAMIGMIGSLLEDVQKAPNKIKFTFVKSGFTSGFYSSGRISGILLG